MTMAVNQYRSMYQSTMLLHGILLLLFLFLFLFCYTLLFFEDIGYYGTFLFILETKKWKIKSKIQHVLPFFFHLSSLLSLWRMNYKITKENNIYFLLKKTKNIIIPNWLWECCTLSTAVKNIVSWTNINKLKLVNAFGIMN